MDLSAKQIVEQIADWLGSGVIRRFGAVVRHQQLGFGANGMAVFDVEDDRVDAVGEKMAAHREISHCYRRPSLDDWNYNLFAMVHGHSEEEVREFVKSLAAESGLNKYDVLFSTTEYKKVSVKYFPESAQS